MRQELEKKTWRRAHFEIDWSKDPKQEYWFVDLLLAHEVISPILEEYRKELDCWRFHRSTKLNPVTEKLEGRFNFEFYSDKNTAETIFEDLEAHSLLKKLEDKDHIKKQFDLNTDQVNLEDISDPKWPDEIRKSWPYFIKGVSEMWLLLIKETVESERENLNPNSDLQSYLDFYKGIHDRITNRWRRYGDHAMLHHLNAMFAYEWIDIQPQIQIAAKFL